MRTPFRTLACFALPALALPLGAAAQPRVPELPIGDSVRVTISSSDPVLTAWGGYRAFRFEARPDRVYRFSVRSDSARAGLHVARFAGILPDYLAPYGRAAGTADGNAELRFWPPAPGSYLLVVASRGGGEFTVRGDEIAPALPAPHPVAPGASVRGELNAGSGLAFVDDAEVSYDLYTFSGSRGQALDLVVSNGVEQSFGRMRDGRFVEIPAGDSVRYAGGVTLADDGEYAVRVAGSPGAGGRLPYTLWLLAPRARPEPRRLQAGRAEQGTYDPATAYRAAGDLVDEWVVHGSAGQQVQVAVSSARFDTYLVVGRMLGGEFQPLAFNDDADNTNSRVTLTLPGDGEYLVRVRPYAGVTDGPEPYTVLAGFQRAAQPAAAGSRRALPETRPVRLGVPLAGRLDESDAVLEDGTPFDAWTFTAAAGQRVTITLRSADFDAYLAVGRDEGGEWMELSSNDDIAAESTHDARVVMVAPDTGEYTIRVNCLPQQPPGAYVLTVQRER